MIVARMAVSSWRRSWGSWFQGGSGVAAGKLGSVGSDGLFMVRDLLQWIGTEPGYHLSQVSQRCHVDAGAIVRGLDWAWGWICGIIYQDRPGQRKTDRGTTGRLDHPARFFVACVPRLAQHFDNLTCQRMVGADDPHIPHSL